MREEVEKSNAKDLMVNEGNFSIQTSGLETRILQDATGSTEDVDQYQDVLGNNSIDGQDVKKSPFFCLNRNAKQI